MTIKSNSVALTRRRREWLQRKKREHRPAWKSVLRLQIEDCALAQEQSQRRFRRATTVNPQTEIIRAGDAAATALELSDERHHRRERRFLRENRPSVAKRDRDEVFKDRARTGHARRDIAFARDHPQQSAFIRPDTFIARTGNIVTCHLCEEGDLVAIIEQRMFEIGKGQTGHPAVRGRSGIAGFDQQRGACFGGRSDKDDVRTFLRRDLGAEGNATGIANRRKAKAFERCALRNIAARSPCTRHRIALRKKNRNVGRAAREMNSHRCGGGARAVAHDIGK